MYFSFTAAARARSRGNAEQLHANFEYFLGDAYNLLTLLQCCKGASPQDIKASLLPSRPKNDRL